jgi:hypothetical protein
LEPPVVDAGPYILSVALLAILALSLGLSAVVLRKLLLPQWAGAPAHLVEAIAAVALLIWISELLGLFGLLYAWTLIASSLLLAGALAWTARTRTPSSAGGAGGGGVWPGEAANPPSPHDRTRGQSAWSLAAIAVVALVFAHWALTAADALERGIFNFDSLWYHMPFATEIAKSHSVTGLHYTETVFTNWFYPQNSELLHGVGILLTERDTLSLFLNFGWLGIAFLAAWCIGRPYEKGPLAVVAAGIVLESHALVVREPGAAKNDLMAAALLLAAIAILVTAWAQAARPRVLSREEGGPASPGRTPQPPTPPAGEATLPVGWGLAAAGLVTGLAVGTKSTALAMAGALSLAVIVLAPGGRRKAAVVWWFAAALAGGGYWYLRNLVVAGNPIPQIEKLGPIPLPHPETLQSGRPDFNVAHYATDTSAWTEYFTPGLDSAFGALWPLVIGGAIAGGLIALIWGHQRILRWLGFVILFGLLAYLFTPLSAAGPDGMPEAFRINLRFAIPALLAGLALLPVVSPAGGARDRTRGQSAWSLGGSTRTRGRDAWSLGAWLLLAALLLVLVVTNRADAVVRDPDRLFAWGLALLLVLIPAGLLYLRTRGASRRAVTAGFAVLALTIAAIGYPVQRDYLEDRYANEDPATAIPGMSLDSAYAWARDIEDSRIGLAGTTVGFLQYGLYGADLSNQVRYLGQTGPHGAFNAIPTCAEFRAAVNAADLDFLVTAPFLNFIDPEQPIPSPETTWLQGEEAVTPLNREGPVIVWHINGPLNPSSCGPRNRPLQLIPQQPQ